MTLRLSVAALSAVLVFARAAAADDPASEDVTFVTGDGVTIAATWYPPAAGSPSPAPAVVALPMYKKTRATYAPMAQPLADRGIGLLAIDLRGHGGSTKKGDEDLGRRVEARDPKLFNDMHLDVEAAIAWLVRAKKAPAGKIALLGASVGCSVAIDTAVRNAASVAAVACLSPGTRYLGVPTMEHIASWPRGKPIVLFASEREMDTGARAIDERLKGDGSVLRLVWDERPRLADEGEGLHGTDMLEHGLDVKEDLADWLALQIAFHRIPLGGGAVALAGSLGRHLYLGVEVADGSDPVAAPLVWKLGSGPVTEPWSKPITLRGRAMTRVAPGRARLKIARESLPVEAGKPFAVAVSLDGETFQPASADPPLLVTLR